MKIPWLKRKATPQFSSFLASFLPDDSGAIDIVNDVGSLESFFGAVGGRSFNHGLYRTISSPECAEWQERISSAFPDFAGRSTPFGYSWSGNVFALDALRQIAGGPAVLLFEPGTAQALEVPANLESFHDSELVGQAEASLSYNFFKSWRQSGGALPERSRCIGYKIPLFLGGSDTLDNLELADVDVYWHLVAQLIRRARSAAH